MGSLSAVNQLSSCLSKYTNVSPCTSELLLSDTPALSCLRSYSGCLPVVVQSPQGIWCMKHLNLFTSILPPSFDDTSTTYNNNPTQPLRCFSSMQKLSWTCSLWIFFLLLLFRFFLFLLVWLSRRKKAASSYRVIWRLTQRPSLGS